MLGRLERSAFATIVLVILGVGAGCSGGSGSRSSQGCTLIGCQNGLAVEFSRPLRETGSYTLTLDLDGERVTCRTALPFAGCATGPVCSSSRVLLEQSGCALPQANHEISGLWVTSAAKAVRIQIERDSTEVASGDFTPNYLRSQPNGEGCEPICEQASATLQVP